jgi:DUF1016 N-terminal domain
MSKNSIFEDIREIISQARALTAKSVNSLQVVSNFFIGQRIVWAEQEGKERAVYGKETLKKLSQELTAEFGRGYSHRNLDLIKKFFLTYSTILPISQSEFAKLLSSQSQTASEYLLYLPSKEELQQQLIEAEKIVEANGKK